MGSLDRLLTYARGEALSEAQLAKLSAAYSAAVDRTLEQLRTSPETALLDARELGRAKLPSNVIGLSVHAAEHTAAHAAQTVTTAKFIRGS